MFIIHLMRHKWDPPTQAEVQALRDKCEELADDMRALSALVHAVRALG